MGTGSGSAVRSVTQLRGRRAALRIGRPHAAAVVVLGCLALVACSGPTSPPQAAPSSATVTSQATSASRTTSAASSSNPRQSSGSTTGAGATPGDKGGKVLGPMGYGNLHLGMSKAQAEATGQLTSGFKTEPKPGDCASSALVDAKGDKDNYVMLSPTQGIAAINGFPGVRTPEGIGYGSTLDEIENAYGKQDRVSMENLGRINVEVRGNSSVVYRFAGLTSGKVLQLTVQLRQQDCYE